MMISKKDYSEYLESLIKGKKGNCSKIVTKLVFSGISKQEIFINLFQKSLYEVGNLWQANKVSVAVEHMATWITEALLSQICLIIPSKTPQDSKKAIIACVGNEYHHLGARIVSENIELNGWDVSFLGANTPLFDLMTMIEQQKAKLVGLSVTMFYNISGIKAVLKNLKLLYPDTSVIFGGQAFKFGAEKIVQECQGATLINSLDNLDEYLIKMDKNNE